MRIWAPVFALALALLAPAARAQEAVYYFLDKKTNLVGARSKRKIIVPAQYPPLLNYNFGKPVQEGTLEFFSSRAAAPNVYSSILPVWGDVYDRQGRFLYHPMAYDNGPDYWSEGLRRFVEQGKVGFVNGAGSKVIAAQWDFAAPFEYGYAQVFAGGWKKQCLHPDCEHWVVAPASAQSHTLLINRQGKAVTGYATARHPRDYRHEGLYYPYPFAYNDFEQRLVDCVNGMQVLQEIHALPFDAGKPGDYQLQYEITSRPSAAFPYYTLTAFNTSQQHASFMGTLVANKRGRLFYQDTDQRLMPFRQWLIAELRASKAYLRQHPGKPFRFDVKKRLREARSSICLQATAPANAR